MTPMRYAGWTVDFARPPGWDERLHGPCYALPVARVTLHRMPACVSYWRPSPADLDALRDGSVIAIGIVGGQPPIVVTIESAPLRIGEPVFPDR